MNKNFKHYKQSKLLEKWDIIIGILVILLLVSTLIMVFAPKVGTEVEIFKNGKLIGTYPLNENRAIQIGAMQIEIFNGSVSVVESNCPDRLCTHAKPIMKSGSTIICVPNQVVIRIGGKSEVEGITW